MDPQLPAQDPFADLSREQLVGQLVAVTQQLQTFANIRVLTTRQAVGGVIDGLNFALQSAKGGDAQAIGELRMLRQHLEQVLKGDWAPPASSRIALPR